MFLFQVFFLVIVFGLFHGLVFLPALLGLIGPSAYSHDDETDAEDLENSKNGQYTVNQAFEHDTKFWNIHIVWKLHNFSVTI